MPSRQAVIKMRTALAAMPGGYARPYAVTVRSGAVRRAGSVDSAIEFSEAASGRPVAAHADLDLSVSSAALGWKDVALDAGTADGWEVRDLVLERHLIAINTGSEPLRFERHEDGRARHVVMDPGTAWVNPAGMPVTHLLRAPSRFVDVAIDPAAVTRTTGVNGLRDAVVGLHAPPLALLARSLASEAAAGGANGRAFADSIVAAICTWLAGALGETRRPGALSPKQVALIADYIDTYLHDDLGLDRLAAQVGYSTAHFARAFRAAIGEPPHRYIMSRRVERARALLITSDLPVGAIAAELGFADHSHLTRAMRRQLGVTPSQLRAGARH
jgi:AraC family transcriptional regulator